MPQRDTIQITGNAPPKLASFLSVRFATVVLLQTLLLILALAFTQTRVIKAQALQSNATITRTVGLQINSYLDQELRTLAQFASTLSTVPASSDQLVQLLTSTLGLLDGAATIIAIDDGGNVLAGAPNLKNADGTSIWQDLNVADRDYFQIPMQTGVNHVSQLFRGRGYGRELLLAISVPVPALQTRPGSIAVVEASLPLSALRNQVAMFAPTDGREYVILSPGGVVAIASNGLQLPTFSILPESIVKQLEQLNTDTGIWGADGALGIRPWLISKHPLHDGWQLLVMLPSSAYMQQLAHGLFWPSAVSVAIGFLLLIGVGMVARKLGREGDKYAAKIESLTPEALGNSPFTTRLPRVAFREAGRVYLAVANLVTRMSTALEDQRATSAQLETLRASMQRQMEDQENEIQSRTSMLLASSGELRESRQLLEDAQLTGRIGIWSWVPSSTQLFISTGAQRLLDTPPMLDHLPLESVMASVVAEDRDRAINAFNSCRANNSSLAITFQVCDDRGRNSWLLMRGAHGRASGSSQWVFRGTILDITERYIAEQRLTRFADGMEQLWRVAVINTADTDRVMGLLDTARTVIGAGLGRMYLSINARRVVFTLDQTGNLVLVRRQDEYPSELFASDAEPGIDNVWLQTWQGEDVVLARANAHHHCIGLLLSRLSPQTPNAPAALALVGLAAQLIAHAQSFEHPD